MAKNTSKLTMYDGLKAVDLWTGDRGWDILNGPQSGVDRRMTSQDYFVSVPWLYRAVKDRAISNVKVAYAIVDDAGNDVDASATWKNELNLFPHPRRLIHQLVESYVMTGRAYLFLETNAYGYVKAVKYVLPTSISEKFDDVTGDLLYYERTVKGNTKRVEVDNIVAIYDPDYTVENGPGASSAAKAALLAAGVLFNADLFIAAYFRGGAIKATVYSMDSGDKEEAKRFQAFLEDVVHGIRNAFSPKVISAKVVTPTVIGQGLEGLENDSLTASKRQDISTAIGVPESRMWAASANFATAEVESKAYFTDVIVPQCWTIEEAINAQLFNEVHHMKGYRWEFRPESAAGFGKDQIGQAQAYVGYVGTGMLPSVAAQIVGIELPGEMEYEDLDPEDTVEPPEIVTGVVENEPTQQELAAGTNVNPNQLPAGAAPTDAQAVRSALFAWKSAALAAVKTGHSGAVDFDNPVIPLNVYEFLHYELDAATDTQAVNDLFKKAREMCKGELVDPTQNELKRANNLMEQLIKRMEVSA